MSKKYQNFQDFCANNGPNCGEIFTELRKIFSQNGLNLSYTTFQSWKKFRSIPNDCKKLELLSNYTGIPVEKLFKE